MYAQESLSYLFPDEFIKDNFWYPTFHPWWRENPNYNPIGVSNSAESGGEQAEALIGLFEAKGDPETSEGEAGGDDVKDADESGIGQLLPDEGTLLEGGESDDDTDNKPKKEEEGVDKVRI
jgi:hypothetical protein